MVPEGMNSAGGHFIGKVLATVLVPSSPVGDAEAGGPEVTLASAASLVERGDLPAAVKELRGLKGLPEQAVRDWTKDAVDHLVCEQAARVVNGKMILHR